MKVLVVSDSHGHSGYLLQAVERCQPDHIIHLGDGFNDMNQVRQLYPHTAITQVPGNCDMFIDAPQELSFTLEGVRIFACHGHTRGVKSTLHSASYAALEQDAQVLLYGHTHQPLYLRQGTLDLFNPGSIGYEGRYGLLTLDKGQVTCQLERLT